MLAMHHAVRRLLDQLDPLPFGARQRLLAQTARALDTSTLTEVLAELGAMGTVPRRWAALMAVVAGEEPHLLRCLTGSDHPPAVMALSWFIGNRRGYDTVVAFLPTAPKAWRQALYNGLRTTRATEWADQLLPLVRDRFGEHEAAAVLPACGPTVVADLLPELDFAVPNWVRLTARYPAVVLEHLRRLLLAAGDVGRTEIWDRYAPAFAQLIPIEPGAVLDLLERQGPATGLPAGLRGRLAMLARFDPARLIGVLADRSRRIVFTPTRALCLAFRGAGDADLITLARVLIADDARLSMLLRGLPPRRRAAILDGALDGQDIVRAGLSAGVLDVLGWRARHGHAERLRTIRQVADDPVLRLQITARLPWPDAEPLLRKETSRAQPADRARAYPLLIGAAAATRDPATVGALLASLTRLRNEQDPVRSAALTAIAALPDWLFRPADADVLERLAIDAVQARDASWQTKYAVRNLALKLTRHGVRGAAPELVDCGLRVLHQTGNQFPGLGLHCLDQNLPHGTEHVLFEALRTRIDTDSRHGRHDLALALAGGLRRRAWAMPLLQDYVGAAVSAANDSVVRQAITLWLAPPATRSERVELVLHRDRSTITVPAVLAVINRERTDLLDRVLGKPLHGRFLKKGVRHVPAFDGYFGHWLPRQIAAYADLLTDLATAPRTAAWERAGAVRRLGHLPGQGADAVRPFLADADVSVVEAALAALAWTDQPDQVLTELLGYADTDRARVAVYAASRCARFVPPAGLVEPLRATLAARKVTSRKEAVRLVAEHRVPGAVGLLTELWAQPDLHRDLRRAIISAARWLLDQDPAWTPLTQAIAAGDAVATALTDAAPYTVATPHRARYAALVRAVATADDPDTALLGLAAWPAWSPWDRAGAADLVARVVDLSTTATWRPAAEALITATAATADPDPLRTTTTTLATAPEQTAPQAVTPDRDRPAAQRIGHIVDRLIAALAANGESLRATADAVALALADHPDHRAEAIALSVAALPRHGELYPALRRIAGVADRPVLAWLAADHVQTWFTGHDPYRQDTLSAARQLATGTAAEALLAVAMAAATGAPTGWPRPWRELVVGLRDHTDPDVSQRARHTPTAPE